jgi:hypothetical protein
MNEIILEVQKQEWRKSYLSNRYLTHLSVSDLERRLDDILLNLLVFSKDGSLSFDQSNQMNGFIERFIHLDEEMCQREISINLLNKANEYSKKYSNILKAIKTWNDRKQIVGEYLVKFSKIEFLNQIKHFGKIRVNPASYYNDSSLNIAVRDDELSQKMILPLETKFKKKMSTGEFEEIKWIKNIFMTRNYPTDFYVYCMTNLYQYRLFDDFDANACLLIYDPKIFLNKFLKCLKTCYSDWLLKSGDVGYFDPYFPKNSLSIPFNKHFRFWYQSEFRIAFKPKSPVEKLEPIDLEIGSLDNCCELVLL